jgi:hypothetical protein
MLSIMEILGGVKAALEELAPGETVYLNLTPSEFERPSFLVEGGPVKAGELGGAMTDYTVAVKVTCFVAVDAYYNSHVEDLMDRMCSVMSLFGEGYFQIGERYPHVTALEGDYQFDYAEIKVTLNFQEPWPEGAAWPLMGRVQTKLKEEE